MVVTWCERYESFFFQVVNDQNISQDVRLSLSLLENEFWNTKIVISSKLEDFERILVISFG